MNKFKNLFNASYLFITYLILMTLTGAQHNILLPAMLIATFLISFYFFKKSEQHNYLKQGIILSAPISLILLITCFFVSDFSRGLPYIIFVPLFSYLSFLYYKYRKTYILIASFFLLCIISFLIFPNYFIYYHNHNAEKNITFSKITLLNSNKMKMELDKDKIIVLDFWTTSCGICFKKFPDLEDTFQKYKNNKKVEIYTVNVPLERDKFENTVKILDSIGYKFPKLYAKSSKEVEGNLKFNTYPHLIIIKNGKIRYDGFLVTEKTSQIYNIESEIDKLLKE